MIKPVVKKYFLSVLLILLSGCATYKPPLNGPTAFLGAKENHFVPEMVAILEDPYRCQKTLGAPTAKIRVTGLPFKIQAGQLLTILVLHMPHDIPYYYPLTFIPQANYTYYVDISQVENDGNIDATLKLWGANTVDPNNSTYHPISFVKREYHPNFFSDGYCTDDSLQDALRAGQYASLPKVTTWTQSKPPAALLILSVR